ncbi:MAG: hypothetical protein C0597_03500 [Marinilabiliales bacterium]|nr:MAG: hypothetical protein C0597_03500 [Marinilabiliales bacterium]
MNTVDIIGFLGVSIILLAFLLNLINAISNKSIWYILLNLTGAAIACYASILLKYVPFIILEGIWALVSLLALIKLFLKK